MTERDFINTAASGAQRDVSGQGYGFVKKEPKRPPFSGCSPAGQRRTPAFGNTSGDGESRKRR